jgi:hypothetical protein
MTWKPILATAGALILAGCSSYVPSAALTALPTSAEPAPVELTFLERQEGPFAERNYYFQLKIANPYNQPMWYVLPYAGDLPLRQDGMFHSKENRRQPFVAWRYDGNLAGGKGVAVKVEHLGRDRFAAFLLPPKGKVEFAWYHLTSPLNFRTLECWEASSISLNATELEHWLPYRVLCDPEVVLPKNMPTPVNLDWDEKRMGSRTDYPTDEVLMVLVEVKRKWKLPVKY